MVFLSCRESFFKLSIYLTIPKPNIHDGFVIHVINKLKIFYIITELNISSKKSESYFDLRIIVLF